MAVETHERAGNRRGWLLLYAVTAALEAPVVVVRYLMALLVATVALRATGHSGAEAAGWAKLALLPSVWSLLALVNPAGGGWLWQQRMGGRRPSARELEAYGDAIGHLHARGAGPLRLPHEWFVVDEPEPRGAVCGDTLMLSRGALESRYLPALVAHELGHLRGIDARLMAAVDRLEVGPVRHPEADRQRERDPGFGGGAESVLPYSRRVRRTGLVWLAAGWWVHGIAVLLRGGVALRALAPAWGVVWREAEYGADDYARSLGEGEELAEFLEKGAASVDGSAPWAWLAGHPDPPKELRIERLRAGGDGVWCG